MKKCKFREDCGLMEIVVHFYQPRSMEEAGSCSYSMNNKKSQPCPAQVTRLSLYRNSHNKYYMVAIMATPPPSRRGPYANAQAAAVVVVSLPSFAYICQSSPFGSATAIGCSLLGTV
jgi:hypothetical protein